MHEYMKLLVVEHKLIDYEYFMDSMQQYEIVDLLELIPWASRTSYEQMRYIVWAQLKPYLKNKKLTPDQLIPLITDKTEDEDEEEVPKLTEQEIIDTRKKILEQWNQHKQNINYE